MIVPSSNTCLEPQTYRLLGERTDVTIHFARVPVTRIALDAESHQQFDLQNMLAAAELLKTADVDAIAWNGTAGSWLGSDHDRDLAGKITGATGIPFTTSTLAYLDAFKKFQISQISLLTPYTQDVNKKIIENYRSEGIEIGAERHLGLDVNESFARVDPADLLAPSRELLSSPAQALIYLCTNLYGAPVVQEIEESTGVPVLDSVAVTLWKCLSMIGAPGLDARWGRLLT